MVTQHDHHFKHAFQHVNLGDVLARHEVVGKIDPEAAEIKVGADMERGKRDPAEQTDRRQCEHAGKDFCRLGGERCQRQRDGQRDQQQAEPRRTFGRGEHGAQEALALAHDAPREPEQGGMQHQRDDGGADEDRGRDRPIGRRGQRDAESILHALDRVSQHDARYHESPSLAARTTGWSLSHRPSLDIVGAKWHQRAARPKRTAKRR